MIRAWHQWGWTQLTKLWKSSSWHGGNASFICNHQWAVNYVDQGRIISVVNSDVMVPVGTDDNSPILRHDTEYCSILRWGRSSSYHGLCSKDNRRCCWPQTQRPKVTGGFSWTVSNNGSEFNLVPIAESFFLPCPVGCDPSDPNFQLVKPRAQKEWNSNIWSWMIFGSSRVETATLPSDFNSALRRAGIYSLVFRRNS